VSIDIKNKTGIVYRNHQNTIVGNHTPHGTGTPFPIHRSSEISGEGAIIHGTYFRESAVYMNLLAINDSQLQRYWKLEAKEMKMVAMYRYPSVRRLIFCLKKCSLVRGHARRKIKNGVIVIGSA
jgi:hypothetical protein